LRNASQIAIRTTFPALRIAGYQAHAFRNARPRRRRAKPNAADSNSPAISWIVRAAFGAKRRSGLPDVSAMPIVLKMPGGQQPKQNRARDGKYRAHIDQVLRGYRYRR
jgi:hypothetical protein